MLYAFDLLELDGEEVRGLPPARSASRNTWQRKLMTIDGAQAAIRLVIAEALSKNAEIGGRGFDALFAMRQAEAIVRALDLAGYEIRRKP
jgi:hypothetical protein